MRPIGVEALEYPFQRVVTNPWTIVIDHNLDFRPHPPAHDAHLAPGCRKRLGVDEEIGDHLAEAGVMARYREGVRGATALEADFDADVMTEPGFVGDRRQRREQATKIDRRHVLPLQFGVE